MILALMPAPLVSVTASTLPPSDSAPKGARVALAAKAPVLHIIKQAAPRIAFFMIPSIVGAQYSGKPGAIQARPVALGLCGAIRGLAMFRRLFLSHPRAAG